MADADKKALTSLILMVIGGILVVGSLLFWFAQFVICIVLSLFPIVGYFGPILITIGVFLAVKNPPKGVERKQMGYLGAYYSAITAVLYPIVAWCHFCEYCFVSSSIFWCLLAPFVRVATCVFPICYCVICPCAFLWNCADCVGCHAFLLLTVAYIGKAAAYIGVPLYLEKDSEGGEKTSKVQPLTNEEDKEEADSEEVM